MFYESHSIPKKLSWSAGILSWLFIVNFNIIIFLVTSNLLSKVAAAAQCEFSFIVKQSMKHNAEQTPKTLCL